ncbi:hypothetical protein [Bacillus rubiinfantis]|uniref:hypothetical protein n=1 Tax=Bacillus rubiinfantis TaxID=1499680 RepID=UPI0005AABA2E|nr:hypothetical protein [Bacillus rubiinfantis]
MKHKTFARGFLLANLIIPWLTLPFLGRQTIRKYFLAGIFISLVVRFESIFAKKFRWWWFYDKLHPKLSGEFPLIWGSFLFTSIWKLKYTYGKFPIYFSINFILDSFFTFVITSFLKKSGIASLVRLKKYQLSFLFLIKSLLLYGFQYFYEKLQRDKNYLH